MAHNYTLPTIKLLFATARTCAYPDCEVPLAFEDADSSIRSSRRPDRPHPLCFTLATLGGRSDGSGRTRVDQE